MTKENKIIPKSLDLNKKQDYQFSKEEEITVKKMTKGLNDYQMFLAARDLAAKKNTKRLGYC